MPSSLDTLLNLLNSFSPGDLVASLDVSEMARELSASEGLPREAREVCRRTADFFDDLVKAGVNERTEEQISRFVEELKAYIPNESENEGEPVIESEAGASDGDFEVLISFIQEALDHLENIEEKILRLEEGNDPVVVNDIFRSVHTIKGVSSFLGLHKIKELSHSLESVLDKLRMQEIEISAERIDLLLAGSDFLDRMVRELDEKARKRQESGEPIQYLNSSLDIGKILSALDQILVEPEESPEEDLSSEELISGEMIENFVAESFDLLDETEDNLRNLEAEPENTELMTNAFRSMHTVKGNAGFLGFSTIEQVCLNIESVLDQMRRGEQRYDGQLAGVLLESIDAIRIALQRIQRGEERPSSFEDEDLLHEEEEIRAVAEKRPGHPAYKPLGEALVEAGSVTKAAVEKALDLQQRRLGEILVDDGKVGREQVEQALQVQRRSSEPAERQMESLRNERKDIRVDTDKLDKLFDLMGELITTEAMVIDNPDLQEYELEKFYIAAGYLSKITREMQEITMAIRMIPLDGLFNKMRRLVRDLSRKFNKNINLEISGQDTEMDRNVMEEISDPLVHIIRNAIDHGIEDAETRKQEGKSSAGSISLGAKYEGNEIWITIKDDGRGLDREKILKKAEENDLLKSSPDSMTDKEVWSLVFEPGFSTAETLSEVSGRGVGMDVVKKNVEKLRGKVDVSTVPGKGTEIVLRIPLTLAIIDGISIRVADKLYSMPINDIISFHKVEENQVTVTKKGNEILNLRKELFPIIKLYEVYGIKTEKRKVSEGIIILAVADGMRAAILADEIVGYKQIVIKALPDYIGDMEGISGCSIMGNGEVSLIIDTNALLHRVID